jgi:Tfp pilus assembly protein PilF
MSAAADAEDRTEKHVVTPGVPKAAREMYGLMQLNRGMANAALAAFETMLKKEPNRLGATVGAAKAAEQAGDAAKARVYYAKVVALTKDADPIRPEIAAARAFMSEH